MKKIFALVALGVFIGAAGAFAASKVFTDVPADAWYAWAVRDLSNAGIVGGYPDGTFRPSEKVNRAEMAVMLAQTIQYIKTGKVTTVAPSDNRTLVTVANWKNYDKKDCSETFNYDKENTTVAYSNDSKGFSINLPFNGNWGNSKYRINVYDENAGVLLFGPLSDGAEGCGWYRPYKIHILEKKSADSVISDIRTVAAADGTSHVNALEISTPTINNLTAVKYTDSWGMCDDEGVVVIGQKYNYKFTTACGITDDQYNLFEGMIKSMRLY